MLVSFNNYATASNFILWSYSFLLWIIKVWAKRLSVVFFATYYDILPFYVSTFTREFELTKLIEEAIWDKTDAGVAWIYHIFIC